ncbi:MAG: hypothetical protein M3Q19_06330 [Pseudomonadota bacterium]|nr:hypothetical protein [Pseudomonadota bacterium]
MSAFLNRLMARGTGRPLADAPLVLPIARPVMLTFGEPGLVEQVDEVVIPSAPAPPSQPRADIPSLWSERPGQRTVPAEAEPERPAPKPDGAARLPDPDPRRTIRTLGQDVEPDGEAGQRPPMMSPQLVSELEAAPDQRQADAPPETPASRGPDVVPNWQEFDQEVVDAAAKRHLPVEPAPPDRLTSRPAGDAAVKRLPDGPLVTIGRIDIEVAAPPAGEATPRASGFDSYSRIRSGYDR